MKKMIFGLAIAAACGVASADELVVSTASAKAGQVIGLDYVATGQSVAFEFKIPVGEDATVDLSRSVSDLPKTHAGQCGFAKGVVNCIVYSDSNAVLQAGAIRVGTITVRSAKAERLAVSHFAAVDGEGRNLASTIRADASKK